MTTAVKEEQGRSHAAKAAGVILGIPVIIGLMLFAFLAPIFASGPSGVPVAVSAPEPMVEQLTQGIEQKAGDEAPEITVMDSPDEVRNAVLELSLIHI